MAAGIHLLYRERANLSQESHKFESAIVLNEGMLNEGKLNEGMLNEGMLNEGMLNEGMLFGGYPQCQYGSF